MAKGAKPGKFRSLQIKFVAVLLIAMAAALLSAALVKGVGDWAVSTLHMSEERSNDRCRKAVQAFRDYVEEGELEVTNVQEIVRWAKRQNHIYLLISDQGQVLVESGWWDQSSYYSVFTDESEAETGTETDADYASALSDPYLEEQAASGTADEDLTEFYSFGSGRAPVTFADGVYLVSIYDFSDQPLYEFAAIASYAVGILLFVFSMLIYHQATIQRVIRLSREVETIAQGDLEAPIHVRKQDELGVLAQHVDLMRTSIMQEMRAEQEAWNANSDLITRMSHDIRTPLTVLLGFLELLDEGDYNADPAYQNYLSICKKNAYQLKELADKLFQYFLVFGHREWDLNREITDVRVLLDQLLGEHLLLLQEQGFQVGREQVDCAGFVNVDPVYIKRVVDNLFSNIEKYADRQKPVSILQQREGEAIRVSLHNWIPPNPNPVESTNIGLKTCERIIGQMGGVFQTWRSEQEFRASFTLPLCPEDGT